jgi:hypothetical protein
MDPTGATSITVVPMRVAAAEVPARPALMPVAAMAEAVGTAEAGAEETNPPNVQRTSVRVVAVMALCSAASSTRPA